MAIAQRGCRRICCRHNGISLARTPMSGSTSLAANFSIPTGPAVGAGSLPQPTTRNLVGRGRGRRGLLRLLPIGRLAIRLRLSVVVGYILPFEDQLDR